MQAVIMPRVSIRRAYITVFILFLINLLNYMDRFTVAGVLQQIQGYFHIGGSKAGLLQTVFIVFYMIFAPICGYFGDRYNRKVIMIIGLTIWSCTTFLSTFVTRKQYWAFFFCRGLVGIGEASYSTVSSTIIADLFVGDKRTHMLALFYFAIPVGSGLGYVVGSKVSTAFGAWQWGLRVTPILGVVLILVAVVFVVEPERGQIERSQVDVVAQDVMVQHSWFDDMKHILRCKTYIWSTVGFTLMSFVTGAMAWWAPVFVGYSQSVYYNKEITENDKNISLVFGGITCAAGFIGVAIGAELSRRYRSQYPNSDALVCAFGLLSSIPFLFFNLILASKYIYLSYVLLFFGETLLFLTWCPVADILLAVIPAPYRATANASQMLVSHLLGDAGSPYIVGLITDHVKGSSVSFTANHRGLLYAFFLMPFVTCLGGACFLIASFYLIKDRAAVQAVVSGLTEENRTLLSQDDDDSLENNKDEGNVNIVNDFNDDAINHGVVNAINDVVNDDVINGDVINGDVIKQGHTLPQHSIKV